MSASGWVILAAALYCGITTARAWRRGERWSAVAGVCITLALLTVPIETHAVKIDLPAR